MKMLRSSLLPASPHPHSLVLWNPHKELCASKCKLNLKWRHRRRWICRYFVMCGLAGVNLCVLVCDWSTIETARLIERIYTPSTSKLGVGQELSIAICDRTVCAVWKPAPHAHKDRISSLPHSQPIAHPLSPPLCS